MPSFFMGTAGVGKESYREVVHFPWTMEQMGWETLPPLNEVEIQAVTTPSH